MTQPDKTEVLPEREPFNDVMRTGDIESGVRRPKRIDHLPRDWRLTYRLSALVSLSVMAAALLYSLISNLIAVFQTK